MGRHPAGRRATDEGDRRRVVTPAFACSTPGTLGGMQASIFDWDEHTRSGSVLLDDGTLLPYDAKAFDAGSMRRARVGQRVRIEVEGVGADRRVTFLTLATLPD